MAYVSGWVPDGTEAEFYEDLAGFIRRHRGIASTSVPVPPTTPLVDPGALTLVPAGPSPVTPTGYVRGPLPVPEDERVDWSEDDGDLAAVFWAKLADPAKAILTELAEASPHKVNAERIAAAADISLLQLGAALSWPTRYAYAAGRNKPYQADQSGYWMAFEVALLFRPIIQAEGGL